MPHPVLSKKRSTGPIGPTRLTKLLPDSNALADILYSEISELSIFLVFLTDLSACLAFHWATDAATKVERYLRRRMICCHSNTY